MTKFILRWAINAIALFLAVYIVPGVNLEGGFTSIIWLALIFGLINAFLRPLRKGLTCVLIIPTLGLIILLINTLLFALTGWLGTKFGVGFALEEPWFWSAFWGALVVSVVSLVLNMILRDEFRKKK